QTVNFMQQGGCSGNEYGYNICTETATFNGPTLNPGTYWVNLQNAMIPSGDPVYWDENSGYGCQSSGCPSEAQENSVGTIPSESFTIEGNPCYSPVEEKPVIAAKAVAVRPSPTQSYRVIYNFTGGADGAVPVAGLVIDAAGNLYGTTSGGGPSGGGTAFKLTPRASGWTFSRLYSFSGANGSSPDSALVRGADGALFGTTTGGGLGDGVLFGLSPAANVLPSVFSNWLETLLYSFTGGSDGAQPGGSLVLDSSGNIYGNAATGGATRGGTLYEFTNGGIQVLHAFPAFRGDGSSPIGVVNGSDGLYGITGSGGEYANGTLYTTAGGYQVLYNFTFGDAQGNPTSLTADQAGNLYGASSYSFFMCTQAGLGQYFNGTTIYQLSPPDWEPVTLEDICCIPFESLTSRVSTDALGNVYGTTDDDGIQGLGAVFSLTCCWSYTDLHDFAGGPHDGAQPEASPAVDAQGNIYGTTSGGGAYGYGVVWEISP
ncbi:MAG: choice-of-anchor tandem repeat GloVer-containing protein, partial [Candidatus Korobacteraceae bacterium]